MEPSCCANFSEFICVTCYERFRSAAIKAKPEKNSFTLGSQTMTLHKMIFMPSFFVQRVKVSQTLFNTFYL